MGRRDRASRLHDIRAGFATWAFGSQDGHGSGVAASAAAATPPLPSLLQGSTSFKPQSPPPQGGSSVEVVSPPIRLGAAPLERLEGAERQYRLMCLRERDLEVIVMAEQHLDGLDVLQLQSAEVGARYWVAEEERVAAASLAFEELTDRILCGCRDEIVALVRVEELQRAEREIEAGAARDELSREEVQGYLAARRSETARADTLRTRPNTPIPVPPHERPMVQSARLKQQQQLSTPSIGVQSSDAVGSPSAPRTPQPPPQPRPDPPSVQFIIECERSERAAIGDARDAFEQAVTKVMAAFHGAAPSFMLYAVEQDEECERRAVAGAYFDVLLRACEILEGLLRLEADVKGRRKQLAEYVPVENQAWLAARHRAAQRAALEDLHEVQMEQLRRDAIHDREQRQAGERRRLSALENAARIEILHDEASERAILWAGAETSWRAIRESDLRAELDRHHRDTTLVWTEAAFDTCIVDERRRRQAIIAEDIEARRRLRSDEMAGYMQARRGEALNADVARALNRDYDDKAAALAQQQQQQQQQQQRRPAAAGGSTTVRGTAKGVSPRAAMPASPSAA